MNEFHKLPSLGELERSNNWGFGDALKLLCNYTLMLANAYDSGRTGFDDVFKALTDVWTAIEDSISDGEIRVKSGRLMDLSEGPMLTNNPNVVVIDKESFLSWYRRDKEKIVQYLSCVDLKIYQEKFLDRLAKAEPPKSPHPRTNTAKRNQLRKDYIASVAKKLKKNPSLQYPDFKDDYGLQKLIRDSGLPEDKQLVKSTFQEWIRDTRKKMHIEPKSGRTSKKVKKRR
jgi:hypothetical protein